MEHGTARTRALITGASSGIGRELACVCADHRHDLVLVARRQRALDCLAAELTSRYQVDVDVIPLDLSVPGAASSLVRELADRRIQIDTLVNNAAFALAGSFAESDVRRQQQLLQLNIATPTILTRLLLPGMIDRGFGRILNLASIASFMPGPTIATYFASKAYLLSFSEGLSEELRGTGVTSTAVVVGPTRTQFPIVAGLDGCRAFRSHLSSPRRVAEAAYEALMQGRRVSTIGIRNKLRMLAIRFTPNRVLAHFVRAYHEPSALALSKSHDVCDVSP